MNRLKAIETFIVSGQTKNFSVAARKLRISRAMVSRHISELEASLGTRLFHRTTRDVALTDAGHQYLSACIKLTSQFAVEESRLTDLHTEIQGNLRLVSARSFGELHMATAIADFQALHKDLKIEMELAAGTKTPLQLHDSGFDLGISISHSKTMSSVETKLADFEWILCASQVYLDRHGPIEKSNQLIDHPTVVNQIQIPNSTIILRKSGRKIHAKIKTAVAITNYLALRQIVLNDSGLSILPSFCIKEDLETGRIRRILPDCEFSTGRITAVYPHYEYVPRKVRALTAFLKTRFKNKFG
jgi:DNA-binding transcriptional LysR family regulator